MYNVLDIYIIYTLCIYLKAYFICESFFCMAAGDEGDLKDGDGTNKQRRQKVMEMKVCRKRFAKSDFNHKEKQKKVSGEQGLPVKTGDGRKKAVGSQIR